MNGCGTTAAYARHHRAGEPACDDCKRAWRDKKRAERALLPRTPRVYRDETPTDLWGFTLPAAFVARVNAPTAEDCWTWTGFCRQGYGRYAVNGKTENAHRLSYRWLVGDLDPALVIDHLCRNRACVNPAHLEQVTSQENTLRGETPAAANAAKTTCNRGHEFDGTRQAKDRSRPHRSCRQCRNRRVTCADCGREMGRTVIYKHRAKHCKGAMAA